MIFEIYCVENGLNYYSNPKTILNIRLENLYNDI